MGPGPDLAGGGPGAQLTWVTKWETKSLKSRTHITNEKNEGFSGRPPVSGRPGARAPWAPPLNPALHGHCHGNQIWRQNQRFNIPTFICRAAIPK